MPAASNDLPNANTPQGGSTSNSTTVIGGQTSSTTGRNAAASTTTPGGGPCLQPSLLFLLGTLGLTTCATGMLWAAIITDHWESLTWNHTRIDEIARASQARNLSQHRVVIVDSYLDRCVTRVAVRDLSLGRKPHDQQEPLGEVIAAVFLVPMHGGIWTLCVSLTEEQIRLLSTVGFNQRECLNYLPPLFQRTEELETRPDWQHRMQNLSISCALVCLIILGSSALVGSFGVLKHQISAVLVTGVMYLLAATFALFTLTIIHLKRQQSKPKWPPPPGPGAPDCLPTTPPGGGVSPLGDGVSPLNVGALDPSLMAIWAEYYPARIFTKGWSLDLGWAGVTLCVLTSVLWILLSKIMRYNPISSSILA
ncbi:uncharacterized protein LOC111054535 isoform X2 [Nilaparvata lugens]|uniref:uncharacterized protein LOC111054535 isoform X2 n=1 Tax=Nilaparvata lugens TaxID=108931 RepID=UPI00193E2F58|nr:uncharacterized protein LOC111054535 isoform X2 [Nilaparvata lugens]